MRPFLFWTTVLVLIFSESNYVKVAAIPANDATYPILVDSFVQKTTLENYDDMPNGNQWSFLLRNLFVYDVPDYNTKTYENPHDVVSQALDILKPIKSPRWLNFSESELHIRNQCECAQNSSKEAHAAIKNLNEKLNPDILKQISLIKISTLPFPKEFEDWKNKDIAKDHLTKIVKYIPSMQDRRNNLQRTQSEQIQKVMKAVSGYGTNLRLVKTECTAIQSLGNLSVDGLNNLIYALSLLKNSANEITSLLRDLITTQTQIIGQCDTFGEFLIDKGTKRTDIVKLNSEEPLLKFDETKFVDGKGATNPDINTAITNFAHKSASSNSRKLAEGTFENRLNTWYYMKLVPAYGNAILLQSHWFSEIFPPDNSNTIQIIQTLQSTFNLIKTATQGIERKIKEINDAQLPDGNDYNEWLKAQFNEARAEKLKGYAPNMKKEMINLFSKCGKDISDIIRVKGVCANNLIEIRAYTNASPKERTKLKSPNEQVFRCNVNQLLKLVQDLDEELSTIIKRRNEFLSFLLGKTEELSTKKGGLRGWLAKL